MQTTTSRDIPRRLVKLSEAARMLDTSKRTLQRRIAAGDLVAVTDGGVVKVPIEAIDEYVERLKAAP
jgi:excisionase family DNA binding protein